MHAWHAAFLRGRGRVLMYVKHGPSKHTHMDASVNTAAWCAGCEWGKNGVNTLTLEVTVADTIDVVKRKVLDKMGIQWPDGESRPFPPDELRLFFDSRSDSRRPPEWLAHGGRTIAHYNEVPQYIYIKPECVLIADYNPEEYKKYDYHQKSTLHQRHMTPCACHCAACHGNACVMLRVTLLRVFDGKDDIVDKILWHYHGASGWGTASLDPEDRRQIKLREQMEQCRRQIGKRQLKMERATDMLESVHLLMKSTPEHLKGCIEVISREAAQAGGGVGGVLPGTLPPGWEEKFTGSTLPPRWRLTYQQTLCQEAEENLLRRSGFTSSVDPGRVYYYQKKTRTSTWEHPNPERRVRASVTFTSISKNKKEVPKDTLGSVINIDDDGDALIDFEGIGMQWVKKTDFGNEVTRLMYLEQQAKYAREVAELKLQLQEKMQEYDSRRRVSQIRSRNQNHITCVQYGPGDDVIAAAHAYGGFVLCIYRICAHTGEIISRPLKVDPSTLCWRYAPTGDVLAVGDRRGYIHFFNAQGERTLSVTHSDPQDRYDGATDVNHTTSYFDRDREWIRHQDHFSVIAVNALCWSPDGTKLASCGDDGTVKIWNAATGEKLWAVIVSTLVEYIKCNPRQPLALSWSKCGRWLALPSAFGAVVYDAQTFENEWRLDVDGSVLSVDFAPCGNKLAAIVECDDDDWLGSNWCASGPDYVKIFSRDESGNFVYQSTLTNLADDGADHPERSQMYRKDADQAHVVWSPCGSKIAVTCNDEKDDSIEGDVDHGAHLRRFARRVHNCCVKILDTDTGAVLFTLAGHTRAVRSICFSSDGKHLITGSSDATVRVWNMATGASANEVVVGVQGRHGRSSRWRSWPLSYAYLAQ